MYFEIIILCTPDQTAMNRLPQRGGMTNDQTMIGIQSITLKDIRKGITPMRKNRLNAGHFTKSIEQSENAKPYLPYIPANTTQKV